MPDSSIHERWQCPEGERRERGIQAALESHGLQNAYRPRSTAGQDRFYDIRFCSASPGNELSCRVLRTEYTPYIAQQ